MPLLLFPTLQSHLLRTQTQVLWFFVWTDLTLSSIQLWTNLHDKHTWHSEYFSKANQGWYQLYLPLLFSPGQYEYTLKYYQENTEHWLGSPQTNGIIFILPTQPPLQYHHFTNQLRLIHQLNIGNSTLWIQTIDTVNHIIPLAQLDDIHTYLALARKSSCWIVPVSGSFQIESDQRPWQFFLYRSLKDGSVRVWIVTTCQGQDAWLHINNKTSTLELHSVIDKSGSKHKMYLSSGIIRNQDSTGMTLKQLINAVFSELKATTKMESYQSSNTCDDKSTTMKSYLGYCTWNAFGQDGVTEVAIEQALSSFVKNDIPIRYLIIDDGWQQQCKGYMTGWDADGLKFPKGLDKTITSLKQTYPMLLSVGVWHTLWGYWKGIDSDIYRDGSFYSFTDNSNDQIYLINDISRFYNTFYHQLKMSGVDMVKVDNQGALAGKLFLLHQTVSLESKHHLWNTYWESMHHAASKYFTQSTIHSMALTPFLLDGPLKKSHSDHTILRNSDDYFPDVLDSHPWHIYTNAMNTIWTSHISSMLDFDMFETMHPFAEYHAASRALSGGPIYITDKPGHHNPMLTKRLVAQNRHGEYELLRCNQPCWPFFDTVLGGKPMVDQAFIGMWNSNENDGRICGYWSMQMEEDVCIGTTPVPSGYIGYITFGLDSGKWLYNKKSSGFKNDQDMELPFRLNGRDGWCLVNVVPLQFLGSSTMIGIACLGLLDKLNGLQAIISTEWISTQYNHIAIFRTRLSHKSSQCGFFFLSSSILLWTKLDGVKVQLKSQGNSIWVLDMLNNISLVASSDSVFTVDLAVLNPYIISS
ncbi:glycoside hydrolase superfamily [Halteromyces radiatus]|uniref:glycoside hydrolase superfamily n=1 Tax=Halteromyces radiatus TaxID=101107 RepID=UPI00221E8C24|nr:glycoside hydrolase superfamily [Halteromyces radiatus]KAI8096991.1 glycoside hydrolase superfamily [Halteromyces radiatus]